MLLFKHLLIIVSIKTLVNDMNIAIKNGTNQPSIIKLVLRMRPVIFKIKTSIKGYIIPRVKTVIGMVKIFKIGFTVLFKTIIIMDASIAYLNELI